MAKKRESKKTNSSKIVHNRFTMKTEELDKRKKQLSRLEELGKAKVFYRIYKPSQIELNILRWFNQHSSKKIAEKLNINRSYVYAVIEKFEKIYTKKELI